MIIEYVGASEINGSLLCLDGVKGVSFEEIVDIKLQNGTTRQGRVVQIDGDRVVIQVFEGTRDIALDNITTRMTGRPMEMPLSPEILGRILDGAGKPIDNLGPIFPKIKRNINITHNCCKIFTHFCLFNTIPQFFFYSITGNFINICKNIFHRLKF